jgi:hypothetical protein
MISGLQNKLNRVERKTPNNASMQVHGRMSNTLNTTFTNYIVWDFRSGVIFNDGILCIQTEIADVYGFGYNFMIMSEGVYSITLDGFVSPVIADLQMRLYVGTQFEAFSYLTKPVKQVNCFGFTPRTAFSATTTYYFKEGEVFSIVLTPSANTTLTNRTFDSGTYGSPYLTVTQLTGAYDTPAEPNQWYTDFNEPIP